MKNIFVAILSFLAFLFPSCQGKDTNAILKQATSLADSIASTEGGGSATEAYPDIKLSFEVKDSLIDLNLVGRDLFNVFASYQLKHIVPKEFNEVRNALHDSKGNLEVELTSINGSTAKYSFSPQELSKLFGARSTDLNFPAAKNQLIAVAEKCVPSPESHSGAERVDVSIKKSFLEYDIVWPKASSYANSTQGVLTKRYFNPLKEQYQELGSLAEPIIDILTSMGIDGVRIVYSAPDSDKKLQQAFPWREIREPIEN